MSNMVGFQSNKLFMFLTYGCPLESLSFWCVVQYIRPEICIAQYTGPEIWHCTGSGIWCLPIWSVIWCWSMIINMPYTRSGDVQLTSPEIWCSSIYKSWEQVLPNIPGPRSGVAPNLRFDVPQYDVDQYNSPEIRGLSICQVWNLVLVNRSVVDQYSRPDVRCWSVYQTGGLAFRHG